MNRILLVILSVAFFSNSAVAIKNGLKNTAQTDVTMLVLTYVLVKTGIQLGEDGFQWLAAHFGFGESAPADIELDEEDEVNAQLALDEVLNNQAAHKESIAKLLDRLEKQSPGQLLKIVLNKSILPEVRFLARKVLRKKHILPMLSAGSYDDLGAMNKAFLRLAGPNNPEARETARYLFDFSHPDPEVQLSQPSIYQFLKINRGARTLKDVLHMWTQGIHLTDRMKHVRRLVIADNPALEEVRSRIIALFHDVKEMAPDPDQELIDTLHELHTSLLFFDSLLNNDFQESMTKPLRVTSNSVVQAALNSSGSDRFPLTGDFEVDALILGFEQDPETVNSAKENDNSDPKHRISKGGGNSFVRGGLIISPDHDSHAGKALKMHIQIGKGRWVYLDTVILVEIEGRLLFLCLGRNKELSADYWSLVDADGNWFRLQRDKPNAALEEALGPQKKEARGGRTAPLKPFFPFKKN